MSNAEKYKEIFRLKKMLEASNVQFTFLGGFLGGYQICEVDGCDGFDVIEHDHSSGHERDRLEIMGLLTAAELKHDYVKGNLTAENVFKRIQKAKEARA